MNYLLFLLILISIGCTPIEPSKDINGLSTPYSPHNKVPSNISKFDNSVWNAITDKVIEAQNHISQIADSDIAYGDKISNDGLIDRTIKSDYFSENTMIAAIDPNDSNITDYPIKTYLQNIANLSYKGTYKKVKIISHKDKMKIIDVLNIKQNIYLIQFQVFQELIGCKIDNRCFNNIISKNLNVIVKNPQSVDRDIKIDSIIETERFTANQLRDTL